MVPSQRIIAIDKGWTFRQRGAPVEDAKPVSRFPTNIHLDLMHHHIITDPFLGQNENDCQWVGEETWVYRTQFASSGVHVGPAVLAFDGLDTYATVRLNSHEILKTESMFIPERIEVTDLLAREGQNTLEIEFASSFLRGKKIIQELPKQ